MKRILTLSLFLCISSYVFGRITVVYRGCDNGVGSYDLYEGNSYNGTYLGSASGPCCGIVFNPIGKDKAIKNAYIPVDINSPFGQLLKKMDPNIDLSNITVIQGDSIKKPSKKNDLYQVHQIKRYN